MARLFNKFLKLNEPIDGFQVDPCSVLIFSIVSVVSFVLCVPLSSSFFLDVIPNVYIVVYMYRLFVLCFSSVLLSC